MEHPSEKGGRAFRGRIKIADAMKSFDSHTGARGETVLRAGDFRILCRIEQKNDFGGDIFCAPRINDGSIGLFLGDMAGHDLSAAIAAAPILDYLESRKARLADLAGFMRGLQGDLFAQLEGINRFMTCFVARLDLAEGEMQWVNCGHPDGLLFRSNGVRERLTSSAPPLGIDPAPSFECRKTRFEAGDVLALHTDGVPGPSIPGDVPGEPDCFGKCVADLRNDRPDPIAALFERIDSAAGKTSPNDDRTAALIERLESGK